MTEVVWLVDGVCMKNTVSIGISCAVLGLSFPALGGDGVGIRYIEHDEPYLTFLDEVSGDGSTLVFASYGNVPSIMVDRGAGLETIFEGVSSSAFVFSGGVSDDGGLVALNSICTPGAMNWRPGSISGIPDYVYNGTALSNTFTGAVSGDGLVNGMTASGGGESRVMLYQDRTFLDLGFDDGGIGSSLGVTGLDRTGSVMAMNQQVSSFGEDWALGGSRSWMWDQNGFMLIPDLVLTGDRVDSRTRGVSSDGSTVFGVSNGVFFDGEDGYDEWGPSRSWIYRDGVQTEIMGGGFEGVLALDITDDGQQLLVSAGSEADGYESYLWTEQGGFVSILELLADAGISISSDSVYFSSMSGDGTVLGGNMVIGEVGSSNFTSVVVTIPSPGGLLMLGGGLLMLSGRRR